MTWIVPVALIRLHPTLKENLSLLWILVPNIIHLLKLKDFLLLHGHLVEFVVICQHWILFLLL